MSKEEKWVDSLSDIGLQGNLRYLKSGEAKKDGYPDWQITKLSAELSEEITRREKSS